MVDFINNFERYPNELTVRHVAAILDVSEPTVRSYIRAHRLESFHIGRRFIILKTSLRAFILASKMEPN